MGAVVSEVTNVESSNMEHYLDTSNAVFVNDEINSGVDQGKEIKNGDLKNFPDDDVGNINGNTNNGGSKGSKIVTDVVEENNNKTKITADHTTNLNYTFLKKLKMVVEDGEHQSLVMGPCQSSALSTATHTSQNESNSNKDDDGTENGNPVTDSSKEGGTSNEEEDFGDDDLDDDEVDDDENDDDNYDEEFFNFDEDFGEAIPQDNKPVEPHITSDEVAPYYKSFKKFSALPNASEAHKYMKFPNLPNNMAEFARAYQKEIKNFQESLPNGIFVKSYEDRMDLFSALIIGPEGTPYEGGLFAFDIKLPNEYPRVPPLFHFISFTKERLNPNLYAHDGKVCVSLLGTWNGQNACEQWSKENSTLLQVLVSIQALILVPEPFYNEPCFAGRQHDPAIKKQAKAYNERTVTLLLQAMAAKLENPPFPWYLEVVHILKTEIPKMISRIEYWIIKPSLNTECVGGSNVQKKQEDSPAMKNKQGSPEFSLLPVVNEYDIKAAITALKNKHAKFCTI